MAKASLLTRMGVNLLIKQTKTYPLVEQTAREFMFGYESALVTLGNKFMPSWIAFDKLGLIDRVSGRVCYFLLQKYVLHEINCSTMKLRYLDEEIGPFKLDFNVLTLTIFLVGLLLALRYNVRYPNPTIDAARAGIFSPIHF